MIQREKIIHLLEQSLTRSPVTSLLGPRQCGKTTLARSISQQHKATYFDLESVPDQQRLQNPELMLGSLEGLVILDEIQVRPDLFNVLRVLVDRPSCSARFLILGSASPQLVKGVSESLAGRCQFFELSGFNFSETGQETITTLWLRGGFPRSFLADNTEQSIAWREGFIRTFLERDIPQLGITIPAAAMRRFWTMLAHCHGQTLNASELGRSLGMTDKTIRHYLDILTGTYMMRQLQPWHENIGKRQVKAQKIFFRDSGILHSLLHIPDYLGLTSHPHLGASWEGFAMEQCITHLGISEAYFWATHGGAELDLFFFKNGKRYGIEFKYNEAPGTSKSMQTALNDLNLEHLWVVYPGKHTYPADKRITMIPLKNIEKIIFE
jgi:uncharacterized protein